MKRPLGKKFRETLFCVWLGCLIISPLLAENLIKVFSERDADIWVNNMKVASILANSDPLEMRFTKPGGYAIEVRAKKSSQIHKEEIIINDFSEIKKTIRAFSGREEPQTRPIETEMPAPWMIPQNSQIPYQPMTPYQQMSTYPPMEAAAEMNRAMEAARAESLRQENARRQRESERDAARQVLFHLLAIENDRGVAEKSKQIERKRLLSGELWNSIFKKR